MKTLTRFLGLTFGCVFLLFPPTVSAEQLWGGNVHAGGSIEHSTSTPLETIAVEAGTVLTISAETDDEWRLFVEDNPGFVWTNADGFLGFEYGGKMLVNAGSIITAGPYICNAIGLGPSAGGANAVLYADQVNPITGGVVPSLQGYVKLTNNTFTNAIVFDLLKNGRLLNDPVSDNSGLDPDEHVVGSLIDWNDDDHNCPDYPTDCDEWDEDLQECGCGEDGIDPPSEPGI